jgi:hypothetical protein
MGGHAVISMTTTRAIGRDATQQLFGQLPGPVGSTTR